MKKLIFSVAASLLIFSSCIVNFDGGPFNCIDGNGVVVTKEFSLSTFDEIKLSIPANVTIEQGDEQKVTVEGDENIIDRLKTDVNGGKWKIDTDRCITNIGILNIHIVTKKINSIKISGAGEVKSTNNLLTDVMELEISGSGDMDLGIESNDVAVKISGSGKIYLEGDADYADYRISGSGDLRAFDLATKRTEIDIAGSGSAEVSVEDRLKVKIAGSGDVYFKGDPTIDQQIAGSGNVIDAN